MFKRAINDQFFSDLVHEHTPGLFRIALMLSGSRQEAEDLVRTLGIERKGGFIGLVFKWERIRLPMENVLASYEGFHRFREAVR